MISGNVTILSSALALGFMLPAAAKSRPFPRDSRYLPGVTGRAAFCFLAGTLCDPNKARQLGLIPSLMRTVSLLGNTSLEMARDLVSQIETLEGMERVAEKAEHISFSASESFKRNYLAEYAYWCEGARSPEKDAEKKAERPLMKIILAKEKVPGSPIKYLLPDYRIPGLDVKSNKRCIQACPKKAILLRDGCLEVDLGRCLGVSCLRCERACSGFRLGVDQNGKHLLNDVQDEKAG